MKRILTLGFCFLFLYSLGAQNLNQVDLKLPKYEVKNTGKAIWLVPLFLGGVADGIKEGYTFDGRKSFERKWGVDEDSFWGSESWRRAYTDGEPSAGYKNLYTETFGAFDAYHMFDDLAKLGYVGGSMGLVLSGKRCKQKLHHYLIDFAVAFGVSAIGKRMGLYWVRH